MEELTFTIVKCRRRGCHLLLHHLGWVVLLLWALPNPRTFLTLQSSQEWSHPVRICNSQRLWSSLPELELRCKSYRRSCVESNFWQTGRCDIRLLTDHIKCELGELSSEWRHIQLSLHLDHISQVLKLKNMLHHMGEQIQVIQKLINATRSGLIECDQVRIQCHWNPRTKSQTREENQQVDIEWRDLVRYGRIEWPEWNLSVEFMSWKYVTLQCFGGAGGTTHLYVLNGKVQSKSALSLCIITKRLRAQGAADPPL